MIITCRDYLIGKLADAGVRVTPITSTKKLKAYQDPRVAAVIFDKETFDRSGKKKRFEGQDGARHKRRKLFSRESSFLVFVGDPRPEKADELFEAFLRQLDEGFYINGNYTAIEVVEARWADEEDSILKSKVAVVAEVKFIGGVYKDSGLSPIKGVEVSGVRKETGYGENSSSGNGRE